MNKDGLTVCVHMLVSPGINPCMFIHVSVCVHIWKRRLSGRFEGQLHKAACLLTYLRFWWLRGEVEKVKQRVKNVKDIRLRREKNWPVSTAHLANINTIKQTVLLNLQRKRLKIAGLAELGYRFYMHGHHTHSLCVVNVIAMGGHLSSADFKEFFIGRF